MEKKIIAHIYNDFETKFGVPRQSGLISAVKGKIIFEKEFRDPSAFRGLEDFSHIWVLWEFSKAISEKWSPTVRPPMLGGNKRVGVFASRAPYRPNSIGMSVLKLEGIELTTKDGPVLYVSGCDMINQTPVLDIKPYLAYTDSVPEARGGFTENLEKRRLEVDFPQELLKLIPEDKREILLEVLKGDPRPSYQHNPEKIYGFGYAGTEIKFAVDGKCLKVMSVERENL